MDCRAQVDKNRNHRYCGECNSMSCVIFLYRRRVDLGALPCFSVPSARSPVLIHQHIETWKGPSPVQETEIYFCEGMKLEKY
jgi:hypothetical protein